MIKQESRYRWLVFGTVLFAYILIVSQRTAPGLITDQLMHDFKVSATVIGLMSSIQFLAYAGLQIPFGILADRFGPNRFLIIGTLLAGIGSLLYSLAPNEYVLIFSRLLVGIGDATIFVNLVLILSLWFKGNEFVKLMGLISMAAGLGFLSATVPFSLWISLAGWRVPFFSIAIILILSVIALYFVLVAKPKKLFPEESEVKNVSTEERESVWKVLKRLVSTRNAWATFLCHFGIVGTYVGFIGSWAVPYFILAFDMSRAQASQLIMYSFFGAMIGGPFFGWLTSRVGAIKRIYVLLHIIVFICWIALWLFSEHPSFIITVFLLIIIGIGNGGSSLTFSVVRGSFPLKEVGVASGFANTGGFLSAVLLPSFFGNVLDLFPQSSINTGFHYGLLIPILFALTGLIGVLMIKENRENSVLRQSSEKEKGILLNEQRTAKLSKGI